MEKNIKIILGAFVKLHLAKFHIITYNELQ